MESRNQNDGTLKGPLLSGVTRTLVARVLWPFFFSVLLLTGCGGHGVPASLSRPPVPVQSLWQVCAEKGGKTVFEGLLAVSEGESERQFCMMDSTGFSLMDARVSRGGKPVISRGIPPLKNGRTGRFLAESFQMIFSLDIQQASCKCNGLFLRCSCEEESQEGHNRDDLGGFRVFFTKTARFGPFLVWRITYSLRSGSTGPGLVRFITLERPWQDFRMSLKRIG